MAAFAVRVGVGNDTGAPAGRKSSCWKENKGL